MNLQPILLTIFIGAWAVAVGSAAVGTYWRVKAWRDGPLSPYRQKYRRWAVMFICAWAVAVGTGFLSDRLGYVL